MKKLFINKSRLATGIVALFIGASVASCDLLSSLTGSDVANGLKEALRVSSDTSVSQLNRVDGYFLDNAVKILLPDEIKAAESTIRLVPGAGTVLDNLILKMNRAAETAAKDATPILWNAISGITFSDAMGILNGQNDAATQYLRSKTFTGLQAAFKPHIEDALTAVGAQQTWGSVVTYYNQIPLLPDANTDLAAFTTEKALDGLFYKVAVEEGKIRTDINHQVTDLLRKVFGSKNNQ